MGHVPSQGPLEWSPDRFEHIIQLKEAAINKARDIWADWIWFLDADAFITHDQTIRQMVQKSHKTVVAPMLTSVGLYANFWAGMTEHYYYKRTDEYKPILNRKQKGCFVVPMVHSAVFINLKKIESEKLTFRPLNNDQTKIPKDDIIAFALSAKFNDIELNVCNDLQYGYIMLPLDDEQSLHQDLINLSNLKTEMYAYGHRLHSSHSSLHSSHLKDTLGMDHVYLINLDRRQDRLSNMQAIFEELGIEYERVQAVDGKVDVNDDYIKKLGIEMMPEFSEPYHGRPLTFGEIGCFMSHYNIWRDALNKNYQDIIVFEDDIRFEPFFRQKLSAVKEEIRQLNLEWDLIFLGRKILHNIEENWVEDSDWLVHVNYTYWTLGYMMTKTGASKLVNEKPLGMVRPISVSTVI